VLDDHLASPNVLDAPRGIPEKEDIAAIALDRKILIERPDERAVLVVGDDAIVGNFWNGAAASDGGQPRPFARPDTAIDTVAVQVRPPTATLGGDPFTEHLQDIVEVLA